MLMNRRSLKIVAPAWCLLFALVQRDMFRVIDNDVEEDTTSCTSDILRDLEPIGVCGVRKCFFRVQNQTYGYLVELASGRRRKVLRATWRFAAYLQETYQQGHTLLERPRQVNISQACATRLNSNLRYPWNSSAVPPRYWEGSVTIQKVQAAPEDSFFFKCHGRQWITSWALWQQKLQSRNVSYNNLADAHKRLHDRIRRLQELIRAEPCLAMDFQMLVHPTDVSSSSSSSSELFEFHLIDLDNCGVAALTQKVGRVRKLSECLSNLDRLLVATAS